MANFIQAKEKKKLRWPKVALSEEKYRWLGWGVLVLAPLLAFTLVEYLNYNDPWQDFTPMQIGLNLIWYYLLELIFYFGRGRRVSAAKWALGIAWGLGMTNHYLISFRGRTLFPGDFLTLGTAVNVAGNYDYSLDRMQLISLLILVLALLALSLLPREERIPFTWRRFLLSAGVAGMVLAVFFGTGFVENQGIEPSMWTTRGNGLALNFSVCLKYMRMEKPEGYSQESLEQLTADTASDGPSVTVTDPDGTTRPVNVIVIMNESFSDLSVLPGVETNQDAMPFLRSLTENTIKGYAYSSVFGGTTANSEYEFLTGNTTAYLPAGTVPYQMYVSDGDPTLVSQMAALGYRTIAAHPYRSSGWNRPSVYQNFGFDEVYFESDFQNREYMRGDFRTGYVTDRCDYENLIRLYEEKEEGEPLFLFNVTMQNHSGYQMSWDNLPREVWLTGELEGRFQTVNQYLSLIYQSDQAFEELINYFSQVEEPTMILLFGDHQPQVATNFYTDVLGIDPPTELAQKKQMVPFFLWANYDIPEAEGVELSLNYLSALLMDTARLPMTGYQKYLLELWQTAPVINTVGVRGADGAWYGENEALPADLEEAVDGYQLLLYNNIFDKSDRLSDFFSLTE
ncbi:LTA synthase family protein [Pseudoflavonifractor phocaeensis]|uniref:LTA synthase family protein n=1 Tax=Pseudoflavonifractor phocaeensis TaxID=1870988 RepID=UPI001959EC29|nr:LTA synthase family protein [Pseudoflavonifractor phocaeensis]MBM6884789.1 LTA synthase family protein [Pseudoflavonifractor phocaeensis]